MGVLEKALPEYVVFSKLDRAINWAREHSISFLTMDLACCGVEMMHAQGSRYDIERFGSVPQFSPRQSDLMIIAGTVTYKIASQIRELYEQMPHPKYVVSMGSCANSGGLFSAEISYSCISGIDKIIPIDVYVPGCPPRPEAVLHGLLSLQRKIGNQKILVKDGLDIIEVSDAAE
jgi:NADH-quinone oxidoreductase subunit B